MSSPSQRARQVLIEGTWQGARASAKAAAHNWQGSLAEVAGAAVVGGALAAAHGNAGVLALGAEITSGALAFSFIKDVALNSGTVISAMSDAAGSPQNMRRDRDIIAESTGPFCVDTTLSMLGGGMGATFARSRAGAWTGNLLKTSVEDLKGKLGFLANDRESPIKFEGPVTVAEISSRTPMAPRLPYSASELRGSQGATPLSQSRALLGSSADNSAIKAPESMVPNPYLSEYLSLDWLNKLRKENPGTSMRYLYGGTDAERKALKLKYAFAVPTQEALDAIKLHSEGKVISVGAGKAYWESRLQLNGVDVVALDKHPPGEGRNEWWPNETPFMPVTKGSAEMIRKYPQHSLLLVWLEPNDPMALNALNQFKGNRFMFVGLQNDVTGTLSFHDQLNSRWREVETVELPHFPGYDDDLHIYERKPKSEWDPWLEKRRGA